MPTRHYALEPGGSGRLELRFDAPDGGSIRNLTLHLDGAPVGAVADEAAIARAPTFALPDGSILRVQTGHEPGRAEGVKLTRNGRPLDEPVPPHVQLQRSVSFVYLVAALEAGLSAAALAGGAPYLVKQLHLGWVTLCLGLGLGLLGHLASRAGALARFALLTAIAIILGEGLYSAARSVYLEGGPIWPVPLRLLVTLPILRGLTSIKELRGAQR